MSKDSRPSADADQILWRALVLEPTRERYHQKFVVEPTVVEPTLERARAVEAKTRRYLDRIHPSGADIIYWGLVEMRDVAHDSDRAEVERLADNVQRTLTIERLWSIQNWVSATAYHHPHPRIQRWLNTKLDEVGLTGRYGWRAEYA